MTRKRFLSTVAVWRAAWPSRCDIPGTALSRNGTVLRCVSQVMPSTWNEALRHECEDTFTDLSEFSFRLSRRSKNPCHWSTLLSTASNRCSLSACTSHPAPATTLGKMTLPLTHSSDPLENVTSRIR